MSCARRSRRSWACPDPGAPRASGRRGIARRAARGRACRVRAAPPPRRGPARPEPRRTWAPRGRCGADRSRAGCSSGSWPRRRANCRPITVETDFEPDLPVVAGEATYVEQIVRNLLGNAAKYTPGDSRVVVVGAQGRRDRRSPGHRRRPGYPGRHRCAGSSSCSTATRQRPAVAGSGIGLFVCAAWWRRWAGGCGRRARRKAAPSSGSRLRVLEPDATMPTSVRSLPPTGATAGAAGPGR